MLNDFNSKIEPILEIITDGIYITDTSKRIVFWSSGAERITGYTSEEVLGKKCSDNILVHVDKDGVNLCLHGCPLHATIKDSKNRMQEVFLHHKSGHRVPVSVRTSVIKNTEGEVIQGIEIFSDISTKEAAQLRIKELEKLALLDPLTQLANRTYIQEDLSQRLDEFRRYKVPFGILFFDIDHFKKVNDTYGHPVGDQVLTLVSKTLMTNARTFDLFGRWGGEEFIGIIRNISEEDLIDLADRLRILIQKSFIEHENSKVQVTISAGLTMIRTEDTIESIVNRADDLMYQSKQNGRNRITTG